jgi:shikimate kinase
VTVWLDCPFSVIQRRVVSETHRPLARDLGKLQSLFEVRRDGYARADYRIEVNDDDAVSAVTQILALPLF